MAGAEYFAGSGHETSIKFAKVESLYYFVGTSA